MESSFGTRGPFVFATPMEARWLKYSSMSRALSMRSMMFWIVSSCAIFLIFYVAGAPSSQRRPKYSTAQACMSIFPLAQSHAPESPMRKSV